MTYDEFINGFGDEAGLSRSDADEQWAGFSRQLGDDDRREVESGGYDSGVAEGKNFRVMYPERT